MRGHFHRFIFGIVLISLALAGGVSAAEIHAFPAGDDDGEACAFSPVPDKHSGELHSALPATPAGDESRPALPLLPGAFRLVLPGGRFRPEWQSPFHSCISCAAPVVRCLRC